MLVGGHPLALTGKQRPVRIDRTASPAAPAVLRSTDAPRRVHPGQVCGRIAAFVAHRICRRQHTADVRPSKTFDSSADAAPVDRQLLCRHFESALIQIVPASDGPTHRRVPDEDDPLSSSGLAAALQAKIAERDAIGRSDVALGSPDHIYRRSDIDIRKWWDLQLEIKGLETALGVAGAEMRRSGS